MDRTEADIAPVRSDHGPSARGGRLMPGGLCAGGLNGVRESLPAIAAEGQRGAVGVVTVADLDGAAAGLPCLDAVASVGVGVAALGPGGGEGHQDLSFYRSLIASPMRDRDSAGFSEVARR